MHSNRYVALMLSVCLLFAPLAPAVAPMPQTTAGTDAQQGLDKLLAPVALYPDGLLAQVLACATSPQQVTEVNKWLGENKNLQGTQLQDAATQKGFDASFVALVVFPDVLALMGKNMEWTTEVGKAFLSDQKNVLASVQRLRAQAQAAGNLKTTEQQKVTTEKQEGTQVIVIQPANPQIIYVPVYNVQTVYVPAPPPPPQDTSGDKAAAALIGFGLGIMLGAAIADDHYYGPYGYGGWGMSWHSSTVIVAGGGWHVPPGARYPYTRPVPVARGGAYRPPSNVYAPTYNNVNVNVDRSNTVNSARSTTTNTARPTTASTARPTTTSSTARPAGQPSAAQQQAARPSTGSVSNTASRGYEQPNAGAANASARSGTKSSAFSGYQSGNAERTASQRGKSSATASGRATSTGKRR